MTTAEKSRLVERLQAGRAKARALRPQRLAECEAEMDRLGASYRAARDLGDYPLMAEVRAEISALGAKRQRLMEQN
jgi:hypothetical protein